MRNVVLIVMAAMTVALASGDASFAMEPNLSRRRRSERSCIPGLLQGFGAFPAIVAVATRTSPRKEEGMVPEAEIGADVVGSGSDREHRRREP